VDVLCRLFFLSLIAPAPWHGHLQIDMMPLPMETLSSIQSSVVDLSSASAESLVELFKAEFFNQY
jgi:hypothetical protein